MKKTEIQTPCPYGMISQKTRKHQTHFPVLGGKKIFTELSGI